MSPPSICTSTVVLPSARIRSWRDWYMVAVLLLLYVLSTLDRAVLAVMLEEVRLSFRITDTEVSLLHGMAFILLYSIGGLPIGAMVDRFSRRPIIFIGVSFWSAATMLGGFASSYWQMFATRMAVGLGEASLSPAAYSLICDRFPRDRLSGALSIYGMGGSLGAPIAMMVGGVLLEFFNRTAPALQGTFVEGMEPWRLVLLAVGLPGIALALLVFTFPEPARRGAAQPAGSGLDVTWRDFGSFCWKIRGTLFPILIAFGLVIVIASGVTTWAPTYLRRNYGLTPVQTGFLLGGLLASASIVAHAANGFIIDWMYRRGIKDAPLRFFLYSALIATPFAAAGFIVHSMPLLVLGLMMMKVVLTPVMGYSSAAVQMITPSRMRGRMGALFLFMVAVLGTGVGPTFIAWLSDSVFRSPSAIGLSIGTTVLICSATASILVWTSRKGIVERAFASNSA